MTKIVQKTLIKNSLKSGTSMLAVLLITAASAHADSPAEQTLPKVVVKAGNLAGTALTVPSNTEAKEAIQQTPGGVSVVDAESFEDTYILNFRDTLAYAPGVYAQTRYAEEVRLSIRGAGLSRGFHLRGINLLQDGIPFNLADGGVDFQEADPLTFQRLEVYRGGNALQYGGTTLGGAVNMVSKTGRSNPGSQLQVEYGSFDTYRLNLQTGGVVGDTDYFFSATGTDSDGYRTHEERRNLKLNSNVGVKLAENVETRFYLSGNIIDQDLAGTTTRDQALDNPQDAGPGAVVNDIARDIRSFRLANKTTITYGDDEKLDIGGFFNIKDLYHPLNFGVIDQDSTEYGFFAQASGSFQLAGYTNRYRGGITSHFGSTDAKIFSNVSGNRGFGPFADSDQRSRNVVFYGENSFYVTPEWAIVTGGQFTWSERESSNTGNPAQSDSRIYRAFNPKLGVLYEPADDVQFFANVSRSEEVPTFAELTQSGAVGFIPLDAQEAITYEVGTRGQHGPYQWDLALYRSEIEGELINFTTGPGIPAATFNADETIHQGIELGLDARLGQDLFSEGDHLQWRNAYTFSDFRFDGDAQFGNNEIAGQPPHFYRAELRYDHPATNFLERWHIAPNVEYVPIGADVDFANTLDAPGYAIFNLTAGATLSDRVSLFVDARNLTDHDYVSTFSTITDARTANTAVFYPGEGRSVYGGVRVKF